MDKVWENRLRRMAQRQGLTLRRARRRDPRAIDHGLVSLHRGDDQIICTRDLTEIERYLMGEG